MSLIPLLKAVAYVLSQERSNKSAQAIKDVGAELYAQITRFAKNVADIGSRLKSTVKAYNDAIPGLDLYIVAKSRRLKQLGAGKGAEAELPEAIELEPRLFSSPELRASNRLLESNDNELDLAASESSAPEVE
jgi:DNA anti-recombination protein RmuC